MLSNKLFCGSALNKYKSVSCVWKNNPDFLELCWNYILMNKTKYSGIEMCNVFPGSSTQVRGENVINAKRRKGRQENLKISCKIYSQV